MGRDLFGIDDRIVVKLPITIEGVKAAKVLSDEGIPFTLTGRACTQGAVQVVGRAAVQPVSMLWGLQGSCAVVGMAICALQGGSLEQQRRVQVYSPSCRLARGARCLPQPWLLACDLSAGIYASHQVVTALACGASYAAPYLGRMNDAGKDVSSRRHWAFVGIRLQTVAGVSAERRSPSWAARWGEWEACIIHASLPPARLCM